jgi:hypothetical protein
MAELTNLESKLAEVLGLAAAAKGAAEHVTRMLDEDEQDLAEKLDRMRDESSETADRVTEVAGGFDGKKTAIVEAARETKQEATEMMETYLERGRGPRRFRVPDDGRGGRGRPLGDRQEAQRARRHRCGDRAGGLGAAGPGTAPQPCPEQLARSRWT